jgi:hypothetical protein
MTSAGNYHKAIVAGIASGLVAAIAVLTGAMTAEDTFGDVATVTWLYALSAFIVGSGITGGAVAMSRKNDDDALNEQRVVQMEAAAVQSSDPTGEPWEMKG